MAGTSSSTMRRNFDRRFVSTYFVGNGIDIGAGHDPLAQYHEFYPLVKNIRSWDQQDGDGMLLQGVPNESFDFVHSNHCLEHLADPYLALENWIRVCIKGGHLVITVPDEDMFEQGVWPSMYAGPTHINTWTIHKQKTWSPNSYNLLDFLSKFTDMVEIIKIEKIDIAYMYNIPACDQSRGHIQECAIEFILRKKTTDEINRLGRLPTKQYFNYNT